MTDAASWPPPGDRSDETEHQRAWGAPTGSPAPEYAPSPVTEPAFAPPTNPYDADPFRSFGVPAPAAGPAWTPPPRPGLIPLRPLSFGALLGVPFQTMRRNPRTTLGTALLIQGIGTVLAYLVYGTIVGFSIARVSQASDADRDTVLTGSVATVLVSALIPLAVSIAASALVQGVIVLEVARGVLGEKPTLRALLRRMRGRIWALIGWSALSSAAIVVLVLLAVLVSLPVFAIGTDTSIVVGVLLLLAASAVFLVVFCWLSAKLALVPSALVIERLSFGRAIGRSWRLTRRAFWRTFGTLALMLVIIQVAGQIVAVPVSLLVPLVFSLVAPTDETAQLVSIVVVYILSAALGVVVGAIGTVLTSAAAALIYVDQRMRTEGLDIELMRFAEERAAGVPVADPFLAAGTPGRRAAEQSG
ncbi:hypothetical protein HQQ80_21340 [Microbacteriaceae bacterium VKM Ac-2855]|nr:hypothetical protein [Microbacteriaceae bacterium VKM Ac-2855]